MRLGTLYRRSARFHWRANLAVALGSAVGCATLTGALIVGDSMRQSLRRIAVGRLGPVDHAMIAPRFIRKDTAKELGGAAAFAEWFSSAVGIIVLSGGASHGVTQARAGRINVYGVDQRFWEMAKEAKPWGDGSDERQAAPLVVAVNESLADELGAEVGDDVLIRIGRVQTVSPETLLGRRDRATVSARLTVERILPDRGVGAFSLVPDQRLPRNAFVPLDTLQRSLDAPERVNAVLVAGLDDQNSTPDEQARAVQTALRNRIGLGDLGLRIRRDEARGYFALESERFLLEPPIERAATDAAENVGAESLRVLTYLANRISVAPGDGANTNDRPRSSVPYSTVAGIERAFFENEQTRSVASVFSAGFAELAPGGMLLNSWAATELSAEPQDAIELEYYVVGPFGSLQTRTASFTLQAIVPLEGAAADPGWTPEYPGVTDADTIAAWDPPFPVDLDRVKERDEAYWDERRATPKAFVTLSDAQRLWVEDAERFGRLTSLRCYPPPGQSVAETASAFEGEFLSRVSLESLGLKFEPVRQQALSAGTGSTDFGMLFVGFSFFLIASSAMLVALLFRLNVERRAAEAGLLLAVGFTAPQVAVLFLCEGAVIVAAGAVLGLPGAVGFAWVMLTGLQSWWAEAVSAPFLELSVNVSTVLIGVPVSASLAVAAVGFSIRGLTRVPVRALLAAAGGFFAQQSGPDKGAARRAGRVPSIVAVVAASIAVASALVPLWSDAISDAIAFFLCGSAMLVAALGAAHLLMSKPRNRPVHRPGWWAVPKLGVRNVARHPQRSLLTLGLVASAAFVITAIDAFRIDVDADVTDRHSGAGGFALLAESAAPLHHDLNTAEGREAIALDLPGSLGENVRFLPFRLSEGQETSCLNLYKPTRPKIIGATEAMIRRDGFTFAATTAATDTHRESPWTLLEQALPDGAVPVIGDEAAVRWQLHSGLGKDLVITDERGRQVTLRFVALLSGSTLQGELIVSESAFVDLFPSQNGYRFFLIECPPDQIEPLTERLERALSDYSFDVVSAQQRLADYSAVQNTYLSTFQALGGFGLVLGTLGLAAVLLRNVWERRSELALMRAVGYSRASLGWMVLSENAALVISGLACGFVPAAAAVAPHLAERGAAFAWGSAGATAAAVLVVAIAGGGLAVIPAVRAPLLPALRQE